MKKFGQIFFSLAIKRYLTSMLEGVSVGPGRSPLENDMGCGLAGTKRKEGSTFLWFWDEIEMVAAEKDG
jgi:hypothetical protein